MMPRLRLRSLRLRGVRARPVRGTMGNVIVVRSPSPCFREALFILREDYLTDADENREELLLQAREAAASFAGPGSPPPPRRFLWALVPVAALALLAALRLLGVI